MNLPKKLQILMFVPTANLTSNGQKSGSHRKFNLKNCGTENIRPQYIVVWFFRNQTPQI